MLTIIIFTNKRYAYLSPLLKDIIEAKANIKLWIIDYGAKNKKETINLLSDQGCNLKLHLKKKKIKLFINKKYYTFAERFLKYLKKVKTKYVWFIGDDDRIDTRYLEKLAAYLKFKTNSGFTLEHLSFDKDDKVENKVNILSKINSKKFNLEKNVNKIGLISTQIVNVNKYKKISKLLDKGILLNYGCPQIYIIFQLIDTFNDWKYIANRVVFYRYGNININKKKLSERLYFELNGCLQPAKKVFVYNSKIYKNIFKKIFFSNFFPWIIYSLEILGKKSTYKIIKQNRILVPNIKYINLILFLIFITPIRIFSILKFTKKKLNFI